MTPEEMMHIVTALDDDPICEDSSGKVLCEKHKREVCQICCCDHRVGNVLRHRFHGRKLSESTIATVQAEFYAESDAFHAAMRARGLQVVGGTARMQELFDEFTGGRWKPVASVGKTDRVAVHVCAGCGTGGVQERPLLLCGRCRSVSYCSVGCQRKAWAEHKPACKPRAPVVKASEPEGGSSGK